MLKEMKLTFCFNKKPSTKKFVEYRVDITGACFATGTWVVVDTIRVIYLGVNPHEVTKLCEECVYFRVVYSHSYI
jgi:hypothetical protein